MVVKGYKLSTFAYMFCQSLVDVLDLAFSCVLPLNCEKIPPAILSNQMQFLLTSSVLAHDKRHYLSPVVLHYLHSPTQQPKLSFKCIRQIMLLPCRISSNTLRVKATPIN